MSKIEIDKEYSYSIDFGVFGNGRKWISLYKNLKWIISIQCDYSKDSKEQAVELLNEYL